MTIWFPVSSLPSSPLDGTFTEESIPPWVDDPADAGAPRRRAIYSRTLTRFRWTYLLTKTQKDALKTFYTSTLQNGALSFNWIHPDTDEVLTVRFSEMPRLRHRTASEDHVGLWSAEIAIVEV